jgi:3-hydroxyisobutyrate dehydrogenase-like beta-hydroxyacid dehydrogenase
MGGPIARNLIRANHETLVFDLSQQAVADTLAAGSSGRAAEALTDLASCDLVFTCLPLPQHVLDTMLEPGGLLGSLAEGACHVDLSTIDPGTSKQLETAAEQRGVGFLQCTLGKTPAHAERAEEPLFIGGRQTLYERLASIWPIIGSPAHYLGTVEASCAVKLISNLGGMTNLLVLAECLRLGEAAGMDAERLIALLQDTGARSFQMDVRGPWIAAGDFAARFGLDLARKDVRLGCQMAADWGIDVPAMRAALERYEQASRAGYGGEDCNAVYKVCGPG